MKAIIICLAALLTVGCTNQKAQEKEFKGSIGGTNKYKIVQINDTVVICLPAIDADKSLQPTVINLNNVK